MPPIKIICIDPGHGGGIRQVINGYAREQDIALAISYALYWWFSIDSTLKVYLTRSGREYISQKGRADFSNIHKSNLFVSIHCNAPSENDMWRRDRISGIETLYYLNSTSGEKLASCIQDELIATFPSHKDRGIKPRPSSSGGNIYVLKYTNCPSVVVETEFLTNDRMKKFLLNNTGEIAQAIYNGIVDYLVL